MAEKELRKLNRRELLQMLLVQCEESERLQRELDEIQEQFDTMSESYGRLKLKLDVKDERLNQKDRRIGELAAEAEALRSEVEELKRTGMAGSAAEAADRIGAIFREAQRAAEEYLAGVRKGTAEEKPKVPLALPDKGERKRIPFEQAGRLAGLRKKQPVLRRGQTALTDFSKAGVSERAGEAVTVETEFASLDLVSGDLYG